MRAIRPRARPSPNSFRASRTPRFRRTTSSSPSVPPAGSTPSSAPCSRRAMRCSSPPPTSWNTAFTAATSAASWCPFRPAPRISRSTSKPSAPPSRRRRAPSSSTRRTTRRGRFTRRKTSVRSPPSSKRLPRATVAPSSSFPMNRTARSITKTSRFPPSSAPAAMRSSSARSPKRFRCRASASATSPSTPPSKARPIWWLA